MKKYVVIAAIMIAGSGVKGQAIELWQLLWALDSSYVIGALPSGEPTWVLKSTLTDTTLIRDIVSDSIAAIDFPSDSTVVENDYGTIIVESPANTFGITVDSTKFATTYDVSGFISGSGTDNYIPRFNGTTAIENSIMYDDGSSIGVGTTSPQSKLQVQGSGDQFLTTTTTSAGKAGFFFNYNNIAYTGMKIYYNANDANVYFDNLYPYDGVNNFGDVIWRTTPVTIGSQVTAMTLKGNGRLGLGTALPSQLLHVAGNSRLTGLFYDGNNEAGTAGQVLSTTGAITDWIDHTDTLLIRQIVSDSISLDLDRDPTNELQDITIDDDNKLILSINNSNVDISHLSENDSTLVADTPMLDLTLTGKTITGIPDTVTYLATLYDISSKFTLPSLTAGSVIFSDGTTLAQDNSKLFYNNSTKRLSVGGTSSVATLDVTGRFQLQNNVGSVFIGNLVGNETASGGQNTGIGVSNLGALTTGTYNMAIGNNIMGATTNGASNIGIGNSPLYSLSSGTSNIGIGSAALYLNNGTENVGIGYRSIFQNTGNFNTAVGTVSLYSAGSGSQNTAVGYGAGYSTTGAGNVFLGMYGGFSEPGSNTLYIANAIGVASAITGNFASGYFGVNQLPSAHTRAWDINGELRVRDLTTTTPTKIMSADADGVVSSLGLSGLSISGGNLVNSNTGTVTSISANAPVTLSTAPSPITTTGTISVDTTASTPSALATQHDISTKQNAISLTTTGTSGVSTFSSSVLNIPNYTVTRLRTGGIFYAGDLDLSTTNTGIYPGWDYSSAIRFNMPAGTNGQVLKHNGTGWTAGTDTDTNTDAQSLTAPSWNTGTGVLTTGISGGSGTTIDLDGRYLTAEVDGSTTNEIQNLSYNTSTRALGISSGTGVTLPLVTSTIPGLVSAYPNNTTSFLRGDGTWATPPTPAVTGTAPIVVTSGNISLNIGTGLYNSSGSLTNLSTNYGYLFHSSGTIGGQSISTTPLTVNFNDQMQGFNMTCNTTSDYVQVTNSGGYEIDYGICVGGISSTRQISVQVYVGSSSVPGTLKRFFIDSGDEDCTLGKHVMDLTAGQQVFLKVATSGAETATFDGPQLKVTRIY